ncbi:MAG: NUDIX hydrolase [Spirochaetes bacterium]|nr:NUDIX hydrolase [Spirochaetota bacterium]
MKDRFRIRVGAVLFINNKILLITHKKKGKEYWVLPGGRVEFKEKAEAALIREIQEELNLKVKIKEFLFFNESLPPSYPVHTLNLFFLVKPLNTGIVLEKNSIIGKYDYFSRNQIKKLLLYPKINNIIFNSFDQWLKKI